LIMYWYEKSCSLYLLDA